MGLNIDNDLLEDLLCIACEEFGFPIDLRYQLSPEDTISSLYTLVYPNPSWVDNLEVEGFVMRLEDKYPVSIPDDDSLSLEDIAFSVSTCKT